MRLLLRLAIVIGAGVLGYAACRLTQELHDPLIVPAARMKELVAGPCAGSIRTATAELDLVRAVFGKSSPVGEMDITPTQDPHACSFEFTVGGDSRLQGEGVVRFSPQHAIERLDFFNRADVRLLRSKEPSFSVSFFHDHDDSYVFESWSGTLSVARGRRSTVQKVPAGR